MSLADVEAAREKAEQSAARTAAAAALSAAKAEAEREVSARALQEKEAAEARAAAAEMAAQAHADARPPADGPDVAHEHSRAEGPAMLFEARHEIGDFDGVVLIVDQGGDDDRRVPGITLATGDLIVEDDVEEPGLRLLVPGQQVAEHRVAREIGKAAPDVTRILVQQRRDGTVADHD